MPHDVTMPQLGMAQNSGRIVSWLKAAGDPVAKGDALFEVETDKATMEIEAQADGFLTAIIAAEGEDVPVGAVIARISETVGVVTKDPASVTIPATASAEAMPDSPLPEGRSVIMPQLGMAQDTGPIVSWQKSLGDAVGADDILFEVETDKSTMDVPAGVDGYLAAKLAEPGDEVPVGAALAIISQNKPASTLSRALSVAPGPAGDAGANAPAPRPQAKRPAPTARPAMAPPVTGTAGRILASPKARRLAQEQGLDLRRLVAAGHPQPYHVRDLETLATLRPEAQATTIAAPAIRLTANIATDGFAGFAQWAAKAHGLTDSDGLLAGLAGAGLSPSSVVTIERHGQSRGFAVPRGGSLAAVTRTKDSPDLILRDLRGTALRSVMTGPEATPVLSVMTDHAGLCITLECSADQIAAPDAIALLSAFAGRMEQPLRHLL